MPKGVGGLAQIWGFENFIHKVKKFCTYPLVLSFSTSCSTVFTRSCSHSIIVQTYILYTIHYKKLQKFVNERERKNPPPTVAAAIDV